MKRSWQPTLNHLFPKDLLVHSGLRITYYIRSRFGIIFVILAASSSLINLRWRLRDLKEMEPHIIFSGGGGGRLLPIVIRYVVVALAVALCGRIKLSKFWVESALAKCLNSHSLMYGFPPLLFLKDNFRKN